MAAGRERLLCGRSDSAAISGENLHEKLENQSFAKPLFLQVVPCSSSSGTLRVAWLGPNQSSAFFGRAGKFRTTHRARIPSCAAESASAPSLSARYAEGR